MCIAKQINKSNAKYPRKKIFLNVSLMMKLMKEIGLTDANLIKIAGISYSQLYRVRKGSPVGEDVLISLLIAFPKITFEDLFYISPVPLLDFGYLIRKRGRPNKIGDKSGIYIRFTPEIKEVLTNKAIHTGRSVNELVNEALTKIMQQNGILTKPDIE